VTTDRPSEVVEPHTRLLKCTLEVENSRAYWQHVPVDGGRPAARQAFEEYWFGARSLLRTEVLMINFRARFDAYPSALRVLHTWQDMDPSTRRLICHWHMQLSDPLYRAFTGAFLVERHENVKPDVTHGAAVKWVVQEGPATWSMTTRIQFASKLLSSALGAGLLGSNRDPRSLLFPRVTDDALSYLVYLLKDVRFAGTLLENPYLASVGLSGGGLEDRLRALPALGFRRQGDLVDFGWRYEGLGDWATDRLATHDVVHAGDAP
jgi:hypothetical protein